MIIKIMSQSVQHYLSVACFVMLCFATATAQEYVASRTIVSGQVLSVPFAVTDGPLVLGHDINRGGVAFPRTINERLFLRKGERTMYVHTLAALRGLVSVRSVEEAVAFARLRTSPATFHAFHPDLWVEILPVSLITKESCYGDKEQAEHLVRTHRTGLLGIVSDGVWKALNIAPLACFAEGSGYIVRRSIVSFDQSVADTSPKLLAVKEWIGKDGDYRELERVEIVPPLAKDIGWRLNFGK